MQQVLVVDDEIGIRELLSEILRDEGYQVRLAENAAAARAFRTQTRPDLVLLDIWMPDTDGISLLKDIGCTGTCNHAGLSHGMKRVTGYPIPAQVPGHAPRQTHDPGFSGTVVTHPWRAEPRAGGAVYYPSPALLFHKDTGVPNTVKRTLEMNVEDFIPVFF